MHSLTDLMAPMLAHAPRPVLSISFEFPGVLHISPDGNTTYIFGYADTFRAENPDLPERKGFSWNTEDCTVAGKVGYYSDPVAVAKAFWASVADSDRSRKAGAERALRELQADGVLHRCDLEAEIISTGGGCYSVVVTGESNSVGLEVTYIWENDIWQHALSVYDRNSGDTIATDEFTAYGSTPIASFVEASKRLLSWRWML